MFDFINPSWFSIGPNLMGTYQGLNLSIRNFTNSQGKPEWAINLNVNLNEIRLLLSTIGNFLNQTFVSEFLNNPHIIEIFNLVKSILEILRENCILMFEQAQQAYFFPATPLTGVNWGLIMPLIARKVKRYLATRPLAYASYTFRALSDSAQGGIQSLNGMLKVIPFLRAE
ncbi:MAG: hypothetical protein K2X39_05610 [Silvanigrellaceae bacterium]|nr:hypothetical protein [Silvanigrellaceae bacterium]